MTSSRDLRAVPSRAMRPRLVSATTPQDEDYRVRAVRAVLAGGRVADVARDEGVEVALLHRWVRAFVDAGTAQVTHRPDPSATAQRDRFLATFAHELRTPLAVATGWANLLDDDELAPEMVRDTVAKLSRALQQLANRTYDVELLAKAALGLVRVDPRPVGVRRLLAELALVDPAAAEVTGTGLDGEVVVDPVLFALVLRDLWIASGTSPAPRARELHVSVDDGCQEVRLVRFADPVDPRVLQALFEPFDLNDDATGVTVGLYLARALTVAHGGTLGLEQDDEHAELWVRLPRPRD